jgi:hypothetical protein
MLHFRMFIFKCHGFKEVLVTQPAPCYVVCLMSQPGWSATDLLIVLHRCRQRRAQESKPWTQPKTSASLWSDAPAGTTTKDQESTFPAGLYILLSLLPTGSMRQANSGDIVPRAVRCMEMSTKDAPFRHTTGGGTPTARVSTTGKNSND